MFDIFSRILQALQLAPLVVNTVQGLFGPGNGQQKAAVATQLVAESIGVTQLVANKQIADPAEFNAALMDINNAVVRMLKASTWAQKQPGSTLAPAGLPAPGSMIPPVIPPGPHGPGADPVKVKGR